MSKLICFDFDGTMVDTWRPFEALAQRYTTENKLPPICIESLKVGYGYPEDYTFWKGLPREAQIEHLHRMYRIMDDPSHQMMDGVMPATFDGVPDTLETLKSMGYTLAIVTAKPKLPMQALLQHHKMDRHFCGFRTHDDIKTRGERCKPYPDQLLSVIRELDFTPDRAVMIGDTCMDIKMANAAKVKSIGVTWGNHCEDRLSEAGADHVLSCRFSTISDIVKNL